MLSKFKLVNTNGLNGVFYKGRTIPFDKIDDKLAEQLYGKTHVLERVEEATSTTPVQLALAEPTTEPAAAEAEAPATGRKRSPST